ncbi:hypothetical protein N7467_001882 [Penicillium canescens]|nr:hypothetical protein N7467_001882 [Penicillium canescens]
MVNTKGSRQRGRPRTDTDEEKQQDRRRKQLRSAQQTYRKRKENTINTLQSRVYELEDGIDQISHSFLAFSSLLLETDAPKRDPRVTLTLRELAQQCLALAKTGCDDIEEVDHLRAAALTESNVERNSVQSDSHSDALESVINTVRRYQSPMEQYKTLLPDTQQSASQSPSTLSFSTAIAPSTFHSSAPLSYISYPLSNSLLTSTRNKGCRDFSQFLIKVCCQTGYQLLVNTPDDMKIQEIFGTFLSSMERDTFISHFRSGLQDHSGDLVDQMATVLSPLPSKRSNYTSEPLSKFYIASDSTAMPELDDLMDARDVQGMLFERGFRIKETGPRPSSSSLNSTFDEATFAKCELLVT